MAGSLALIACIGNMDLPLAYKLLRVDVKRCILPHDSSLFSCRGSSGQNASDLWSGLHKTVLAIVHQWLECIRLVEWPPQYCGGNCAPVARMHQACASTML